MSPFPRRGEKKKKIKYIDILFLVYLLYNNRHVNTST